MQGVQGRSGTIFSVIGHGAFVALVFLIAGAKPFSPTPADAISVELVPATEVPKPAEKPDTPTPLNWSDKKEEAASSSAPAPAPPPPAQSQPAAQAPAAAPAQAPQPTPQASAFPAPSTVTSAATKTQDNVVPSAAQSQPSQVAAMPGPTAASDLTERYGVMLGLPEVKPADFDALAIDQAKIGANFVAEFHKHLRTCSVLPASISPADDVKITLRAVFTTDGRLARPPTIVEASASVKGPLLMQASVKALTECQPYVMLPPEKYNEWRVLDLKFTPADFAKG